MAATPTKGVTTLSSAQNVAAATPTVSTNTFTATTSFGYGVAGTITNGTGITLLCQVQLQGSGDNSLWEVIDIYGGNSGDGAVTNFWFNQIQEGYSYYRLNYTGNTGAACTLSAIIVYCTGFFP